LPYLPPDDVKRLIAFLSNRFPGSEIVFDTVSEWVSRRSIAGRSRYGSFTQPPMPWGISETELSKNGSELPGLEILSQQNLRDHYRWRWGLSGLLSVIPYVRNKLYVAVVHARFVSPLMTVPQRVS